MVLEIIEVKWLARRALKCVIRNTRKSNNMKKSGKSDEATKKLSSPLSSSANGGGASGISGQGHRFSLNMTSTRAQKSDDPGKIFKLIDDNVIGKSAVFLGPYGRRKGKHCIILRTMPNC